MQHSNFVFFLIFSTIIFCSTDKIFAQNQYSVNKFDVKISGSSNLHDWTAEITDLTGNFINVGTDIYNVKITVNAQKIKSSEGEIMDGKMQKALKTKQYPQIFYNSQATKTISVNNNTFIILATANLTIASVTQTIKHKVTCKKTENQIQVSGSFDLFMTDYNITPPTAMFGALSTNDSVNINFSITFQ